MKAAASELTQLRKAHASQLRKNGSKTSALASLVEQRQQSFVPQNSWWAELAVAVQQAVGSTALGRAWPLLEHVLRLAADGGARAGGRRSPLRCWSV